MADNLTTTTRLLGTGLTSVDFYQLAEVPPALTWFANIDNPQTRRAYENDVREFMAFAGIDDPHAFRQVGRGHVLAWRHDLKCRALGGATIRRKLSALVAVRCAVRGQRAQVGIPANVIAAIVRRERPGTMLVDESVVPAAMESGVRQLHAWAQPTLRQKWNRWRQASASFAASSGLRPS